MKKQLVVMGFRNEDGYEIIEMVERFFKSKGSDAKVYHFYNGPDESFDDMLKCMDSNYVEAIIMSPKVKIYGPIWTRQWDNEFTMKPSNFDYIRCLCDQKKIPFLIVEEFGNGQKVKEWVEGLFS